jgi:hypothetical protein
LHWSRAHRFFSETKWDLDTLGLHLAHLAVSLFVAAGTAITIAVDDTLFHRYGKLVYGAAWQHDGSAKGRDGIGRGNCFVVAGQPELHPAAFDPRARPRPPPPRSGPDHN